MNLQAFAKLENLNWRVIPFFDSVSCHAGKSFDARSGRSAGWWAENIMSSVEVLLGCETGLQVAREVDIDRNPEEGE